MSKVAIVRTDNHIKRALYQAMKLAGLSGIIEGSDTVLVKPNQHGAAKGVTSADVIRAVVNWVFDCGVREVWVGDGPVWSLTDIEEYFESTGLLDVCEETGAVPLNFHDGDYRLIEPASEHLPSKIGISQYLYEADAVINLPLMKTHFNTLVSLGVKNLKGCLRPADKRQFHQRELNAAIAEAYWLLQPEVTATVMDATTAMEGMGPGAGTPVRMNLLVAGENTIGVDAIACRLMGIDVEDVRLLRFCRQFMPDTASKDRPIVVGEEDIADLQRRFELPYEAMAREFGEVSIEAEGACSGCALNLFRALEIAKKYDQPIAYDTIVVGAVTDGCGTRLLVGDCTKAGWERRDHVEGCPPTVEEIRHSITRIGPKECMPKS